METGSEADEVNLSLAVARRLPPAPVLLGWLIALHVVLKIVVFPFVISAPPHGDEHAYLNGGMALSNLVRDLFGFTSPDQAELDRNLVASGWFMPGMSILVTPLYVLFPDAGPVLLRGYLGLVTLVLFIAVLRAVVRTLGHRWAIALAVFPGLVPMWVVFTYGAWGDLNAGLVLVLVVLKVVEIGRGLRRDEAPTLRDGVVLGLLSVVTLYLRSSTAILLAGLGAVTLVAAVIMLRGRVRGRAVASASIAAALFFLLLAPWSVYASDVLGARVLTTTTVPTVKANTFGDRSEVCFGRCDPDSTLWFRPLRYAREVGRATDTSEVEVLQQMSGYALQDVTLGGYLDQVDHNLAAYSLQPAVFVIHMSPDEGRGWVGTTGGWIIKVTTWLTYFPALLLVAAFLLTPVRRSLEARVLDVLIKLSLGALLVQPFVHVAGGRYWTTAAPFFGMAAAAFLWERLIASGRVPPPADGVTTSGDATAVTWLSRVQVLLCGATAAVAVVLAAAIVV